MSRVVVLFGSLLVSAFSSASPLPPQSLSDVIAQVSGNVQEFKDLLPDFVCSEKITSSRSDSVKVVKERIVESTFRGIQKPSRTGNIRRAFTETREVTAIDGKPVRAGTGFPQLPFVNAGGYGSLLVMTLLPENTA